MPLPALKSQDANLHQVLSPLFGQAYQSAKRANSSEQFIQSKEATNVAVAWGTTVSTTPWSCRSSRIWMLTIPTGCRIRPSELWCWSPDQRDWNPVLQGRRLPRRPYLPGHLCTNREFTPSHFVECENLLTGLCSIAVHHPSVPGEARPRDCRYFRRCQGLRDRWSGNIPDLVGHPDKPLRVKA